MLLGKEREGGQNISDFRSVSQDCIYPWFEQGAFFFASPYVTFVQYSVFVTCVHNIAPVGDYCTICFQCPFHVHRRCFQCEDYCSDIYGLLSLIYCLSHWLPMHEELHNRHGQPWVSICFSPHGDLWWAHSYVFIRHMYPSLGWHLICFCLINVSEAAGFSQNPSDPTVTPFCFFSFSFLRQR